MTLPRPHMPLPVKLRAALIALDLDPDNVDWDHDPPLALRYFDEETGTYKPDANDPNFIKPLGRKQHRHKTGGDLKQIAAKKREKRATADKVNKQAARTLGISTPATKAKGSKWPTQKLPTKNKGGQRRATRPLTKTVTRIAR